MKIKTRILLSIVLVSILSSFVISAAPITNIALACGSPKPEEDSDKRKWEPDTTYLKSDNSIQTTASYQDPSLISPVPYMTARIFNSPAKYSIPIEANARYFLRLHFYPSTYTGLNIADSFFAVTANGVTLLTNFSAAITCEALTQAYLVNEYSLAPSTSGVLEIDFSPKDKSFAFVNGIEVIKMPDMFDTGVLVGFSDQTVDAKTENLQTMVRLNVGGQNIPASKDSGGLLRTWYADTPYVFSAGVGVNLQASDNFKIQYKTLPLYSAPDDVYETARSQGPTGNLNVQFNLTWSFKVDAGYTYLLRLHFCEFQLAKVNQRVFSIFINNQTAQADADIIAWTSGKGVPTYKDYAIFVKESDNGADNTEIWLQMTPSSGSKPEFLDSQLNGLEIFKINDMNKNLSGPNPQPSPLPKAELAEKSFKNKHIPVIVGSAGGAAAILVCAMFFVAYKRQKRGYGSDTHTSSWLPLYGNSTVSGKSNSGASSHLSTLAGGLCRRFSLPEIKHGTKNFDESNVVGVGGFGKVYKGVIDNGTKVAIKRSNPNSEQGINEFETEIELLSRLRHKHLVSLIGFCDEDGEMCLIYDYMARGTLREHLYNTKKPLPWKQRLELCIGAARGLHYLHTGARYTIIHRDVKTTNILLDENWVAKVSDFGLSKTGPDMTGGGHVSTVVKGSFGYLDPEYFRRQQLTEKSDVYSFGVVLFEALCARPVLMPNLPKEQVSLADWALHCKRKGTLEDLTDPLLKGKIDPECFKKFADTAEKCLADHGMERPSMGDVLWNLEFALQLQESAEGSRARGRSQGDSISDDLNSHEIISIGTDDPNDQSIDNESDTTGIFSQIVNPKGR